jgi:hypothetical protein
MDPLGKFPLAPSDIGRFVRSRDDTKSEEVVGMKVSGLDHTLPTNTVYARLT